MPTPTEPRLSCSPLAVLGCGCGLAAMVGIALIFLLLGLNIARARRDPVRYAPQPFTACQAHLRLIASAVDSYQHDYHRLPTRLRDLQEHYLPSPDVLRCPLEASSGQAYVYTPDGTEMSSPLVTCVNHGQGKLVLLRNGQIRLPRAF